MIFLQNVCLSGAKNFFLFDMFDMYSTLSMHLSISESKSQGGNTVFFFYTTRTPHSKICLGIMLILWRKPLAEWQRAMALVMMTKKIYLPRYSVWWYEAQEGEILRGPPWSFRSLCS
jgi:hypothetical protein